MVHFAHGKHFFFRKCKILSFHDCLLLFALVWNDILLFLVVSVQSQDIWPAFSTEFSLSERPSAPGKDFLCLMHSDRIIFPQTCMWISLHWTISDDREKPPWKKGNQMFVKSKCTLQFSQVQKPWLAFLFKDIRTWLYWSRSGVLVLYPQKCLDSTLNEHTWHLKHHRCEKGVLQFWFTGCQTSLKLFKCGFFF